VHVAARWHGAEGDVWRAISHTGRSLWELIYSRLDCLSQAPTLFGDPLANTPPLADSFQRDSDIFLSVNSQIFKNPGKYMDRRVLKNSNSEVWPDVTHLRIYLHEAKGALLPQVLWIWTSIIACSIPDSSLLTSWDTMWNLESMEKRILWHMGRHVLCQVSFPTSLQEHLHTFMAHQVCA
jgi:hypothetical protein